MIYIIEVEQKNDGWYAYCKDQITHEEIMSAYHPTSQLTAFSDLLDMMKEELA